MKEKSRFYLTVQSPGGEVEPVMLGPDHRTLCLATENGKTMEIELPTNDLRFESIKLYQGKNGLWLADLNANRLWLWDNENGLWSNVRLPGIFHTYFAHRRDALIGVSLFDQGHGIAAYEITRDSVHFVRAAHSQTPLTAVFSVLPAREGQLILHVYARGVLRSRYALWRWAFDESEARPFYDEEGADIVEAATNDEGVFAVLRLAKGEQKLVQIGIGDVSVRVVETLDKGDRVVGLSGEIAVVERYHPDGKRYIAVGVNGSRFELGKSPEGMLTHAVLIRDDRFVFLRSPYERGVVLPSLVAHVPRRMGQGMAIA